MDQPKAATKPGPTVWEIPDDVWPMLQTIVDAPYPATPTGQRRVDRRRALNGILFRLRPGGPWNRRPQPCGDGRTVHRHVQHWGHQGRFERR
jgi:transposase